MNQGGQFFDQFFTNSPLSGVSEPGSILVSTIRPDITTWAELAAIVTVGAELPVILEWVEANTGITRTVLGQLGSDATNTAEGVQRADDWADSGVVWYQVGNAG